MSRYLFTASLIILGLSQAVATANCPTGYPNEIFCDDFDTYCTGGGYPGDPKTCTESDKAGGNPLMREVWYYTTDLVGDGVPAGTTFTIEDDQTLINSPYHGVRLGKYDLGQQTVRDWVDSPLPGEPGQILDIHRLVGNVFGPQYAAVAATDAAPLVMEFFMAANAGKLFWSSGYMELAYGDETSPNRSNTDFAWTPYCGTYCQPPITQGPFQIMCAQGNPEIPLPSGCPSAATAPVHQTIAVGALSMLDTDPCHCGVQAHGPITYHLALYDGKLWWMLRSNTPAASSGTIAPKDDAPMPPPSDIVAGDFGLSSPSGAKSSNYIVLTLKTNTIKIEHTALIQSAVNGASYWVYNVMDDIPRQYTGPFDRIRGGVAPGCALDSNASWDTCAAGTDRGAINSPKDYFVDFDDFVLHGGIGYSVNGACCLNDASCVDDITQNGCEAEPPNGLGGRWQGSSSTCATTSCCPYPFADADHDTDVDQDDFGLFQICYTGTNGGVPAGCECFNRNEDGGIDIMDFNAFKNCYTGANVPWAQSLTPSCTP